MRPSHGSLTAAATSLSKAGLRRKEPAHVREQVERTLTAAVAKSGKCEALRFPEPRPKARARPKLQYAATSGRIAVLGSKP